MVNRSFPLFLIVFGLVFWDELKLGIPKEGTWTLIYPEKTKASKISKKKKEKCKLIYFKDSIFTSLLNPEKLRMRPIMAEDKAW